MAKCAWGVAITLALSAIGPAQSQVFSSSVPGIGAVDIQIGFAPPDPFVGGICEPRATWPGDTVSTPFATYIVMTRTVDERAIAFTYELKIITPSGRVWSYPGTSNELQAGFDRWCWAFNTDNANELGTYVYRYLINNLEVGRLSVRVRPGQ
jgi:hypothetical protein